MSFDDPIVSISHRFLFIPYANCVLLNFSQVIHGNLKLNEALRACCLQGVVSFQKLHYHVKIARKALLSHAPAGHASREGLLIGVCGRASSDCTVDTRTTISPLTEASALSAAMAFPQQPLAVEEAIDEDMIEEEDESSSDSEDDSNEEDAEDDELLDSELSERNFRFS